MGTRVAARLAATLAAAVALGAPVLLASPMMSEGWDTLNNVSGWVNSMGPDGATLGNSANYLSISFAAETVPLPDQGDIVKTGPGSAAGLTGNYIAAGIQSVNFRFLAQDYAPDGLALYFASASHVWFLPLDTSTLSVGTFAGYSASLDYGTGWMGGPGTDAAAFLNDLAAVDWIGVYIGRNYAGCDLPPAQAYGLDDFTAYTATPEPDTVVLLLSALAPLLVVFRRIRAGKL